MSKRFTFAEAKKRIVDLEGALKDALLIQDNNVYDKREQRFIKFYQWGFYVLVVVNAIQLYYGR